MLSLDQLQVTAMDPSNLQSTQSRLYLKKLVSHITFAFLDSKFTKRCHQNKSFTKMKHIASYVNEIYIYLYRYSRT